MELVELGKLCYFINGDRGKNYPSQSSFISKGIPFISAKDLIDKSISKDKLRYIPETVYNKLGSGKLQNNDILFCLRGSLGKFGINHDNIKGAIASSLVIIRPKKELNLIYLGHYLSSPLFDRLVFKSDNGSSQPNLSVKNVKTFKIPLPPLKTQKKIAAILDEADKLRQLNKALIQKYEALTQSLFLDMFGDPVLNPMGWKVKELQNLTTKIGSGSTPRGGKQAYHKEGISLIRSLNVYDAKFKYKNLAFINDEQADKLKNVIIEENDVLFNITGASICRSTIVPKDVLPARVNQHVSIIRTNKQLNSVFLNYFLISKNIKGKLLGVGSGSGAIMQAITKEKLKSFNIITPPLNLQNEFAERIKIIETQKQQAQEALEKADNLFNSLLQKAFKGALV